MTDKEKYGNKGKNLLAMTDLGLPIPPFVIIDANSKPTKETIEAALLTLNAPFVSIRSSPSHSLPGVLDTTLNVNGKNVDLAYLIVNDILSSVNFYEERVNIYKQNEGIEEEITSAAIIQRMVFGNAGETSGTGVVFSSNPITGEEELYGEFLINAQGQELVDGSTTPMNIKQLRDIFPEIYNELKKYAKALEENFKAIQDIEFTFEEEKLYILQTRNAKILQKANYQFYTRLFDEGKISVEEWSKNITINNGINKFVQREYDKNEFMPVAQGIGASSGLLFGKVILNKEGLKLEGEKIYVAELTSTDDIDIISGVEGILTINGGKTSHAAIVSRSWGKVCVVGCEAISIDGSKITIGNKTIEEGDSVLIDGDTGEIYLKK